MAGRLDRLLPGSLTFPSLFDVPLFGFHLFSADFSMSVFYSCSVLISYSQSSSTSAARLFTSFRDEDRARVREENETESNEVKKFTQYFYYTL